MAENPTERTQMPAPPLTPAPPPLVELCSLCEGTGVFTRSCRESLRSTCPSCGGNGYDLTAILENLGQ